MDILDEIIDLGERRGMLSYDEINNAFPTEYNSAEEIEEFMGLLRDMGIRIVDNPEPGTDEEESSEVEERGEFEQTEDLIRTYFHSIGKVSVLTKHEERELAKTIKRGKRFIRGIITEMPLYGKIKASLHGWRQNNSYKEEVLNKSLEAINDLISDLRLIEDKYAIQRASVTSEERREDKYRDSVGQRDLYELERELKTKHERIESEVGLKIDAFQTKYARIIAVKQSVDEAKNKLILHNLRLVINIAKNHRGKGLPLLDLIQEGNIGLFRAIDRFDYKKGYKFSTYAVWWINQAVTRALMDQTKTIRLPVHMIEFYNKITRACKELVQGLGRQPTKKEIAQSLGVSVRKIELLLGALQVPMSLQTTAGERATVEMIISDSNSPCPYIEAARKEVAEQIMEVLHTLSPREEQIIKMRFGIGFDKDYTLQEIGDYLSLTRERIRQIEQSAFKKLRNPKRLSVLKILEYYMNLSEKNYSVPNLSSDWTSSF